MMEEMNAAKVVKKVRQRLEVSQEGLARLLNATKGAVQHWERGRNRPDLARLLALRQLCPAGAERKELEALIKETQAQVAPLPTGQPGAGRKGPVSGPAWEAAARHVGPGLTAGRAEAVPCDVADGERAATLASRKQCSL